MNDELTTSEFIEDEAKTVPVTSIESEQLHKSNSICTDAVCTLHWKPTREHAIAA